MNFVIGQKDLPYQVIVTRLPSSIFSVKMVGGPKKERCQQLIKIHTT